MTSISYHLKPYTKYRVLQGGHFGGFYLVQGKIAHTFSLSPGDSFVTETVLSPQQINEFLERSREENPFAFQYIHSYTWKSLWRIIDEHGNVGALFTENIEPRYMEYLQAQ